MGLLQARWSQVTNPPPAFPADIFSTIVQLDAAPVQIPLSACWLTDFMIVWTSGDVATAGTVSVVVNGIVVSSVGYGGVSGSAVPVLALASQVTDPSRFNFRWDHTAGALPNISIACVSRSAIGVPTIARLWGCVNLDIGDVVQGGSNLAWTDAGFQDSFELLPLDDRAGFLIPKGGTVLVDMLSDMPRNDSDGFSQMELITAAAPPVHVSVGAIIYDPGVPGPGNSPIAIGTVWPAGTVWIWRLANGGTPGPGSEIGADPGTGAPGLVVARLTIP